MSTSSRSCGLDEAGVLIALDEAGVLIAEVALELVEQPAFAQPSPASPTTDTTRPEPALARPSVSTPSSSSRPTSGVSPRQACTSNRPRAVVPRPVSWYTGTGALTPALRIVHRVIARFLIKQAGVKRMDADTGAVTLIQRFGSAANLNIHLRCLLLDGSAGELVI